VPSLFGETLEELMKNQEKDGLPPVSVPRILIFLTDAIIKLNGSRTEGIFRVPGDIDMVNGMFVFYLYNYFARFVVDLIPFF
jgi:hypothetical protein